jgi:hypothetical protein
MMAFCRSRLAANCASVSLIVAGIDFSPAIKCNGNKESPGAYMCIVYANRVSGYEVMKKGCQLEKPREHVRCRIPGRPFLKGITHQ